MKQVGIFLVLALCGGWLSGVCWAAEKEAAGRLTLTLRRRAPDDPSALGIRREEVVWDARKTAAIVCDMWDKHWCKGATRRVGQMAPRMNELLRAVRERGGLIIHAPSDTMGHYKAHAGRKLARSAPRAADLPAGIERGCGGIESEKGSKWPIDQSDGGCDCRPKCPGGGPWRKQIETIEIHKGDAITDSGVETWNLLAQRGIENVLLMGVHTNMCVIGRPFGLRNLVRCGKNVVLVRDMTDTMYNSRKAPFVSHFRGTELIVEHIEKHVCPTTTSADVLGGEPFRFPGDGRPRVLVAIAEREYQTAETLPPFAHDVLGNRLGCSVTIVHAPPGKGGNVIVGLAEALRQADLLFLSVRRRALPEGDIKALRAYVRAGKPVIGIRTASHAFDTGGRHPKGHAEWRSFDPDVLGGHYHGHYGSGASPVTVVKGAEAHPILKGIKAPFTGHGSLYRTSPLAKSARPLLMGTIAGKAPEPVAWTNQAGKSRVFYTSLGHPKDFEGKDPPLVRLLTNAVFWALDKPVPKARRAR